MKFNFLKTLSTSLVLLSQTQSFAGTVIAPTEAPPAVKEAGLSPNLDLTKAPSNDTYFGYQWALSNDGQSYVPTVGDLFFEESILSDNKFQIGWKNFDDKMQRDAVVAVLDSGMYVTKGGHPELKEALLPGKNFVEPNSIVYDDKIGHGTHIAGIIAAKINNNMGISGMSNKIKILPLKVYGEKDGAKATGNDPDGSDNTASNEITPRIIKAIDYAISQKVDVIQLSLGWPRKEDSKEVHEAFIRAANAGIIIVAASGNDGHTAQIYPCAYKEVLCVGSISLDGSTSSFSNRGGHVDLMAPGQAILSTIPPTISSLKFGAKGYEIKNGTSQAAPFVSGAAAILRAIYPNETADQIKNRLRLGAVKINEDSTFGLLNIENAIKLTSSNMAFAETKSVEDAVVDKNNLTFEFPVSVFSNLSSLPKVNVLSKNSDIKIVSVTQSSQNGNETIYRVLAKADSLQTNNLFNYEVQVNDRKQISQLILKLKLEDMNRTTLAIDDIEPIKKTGFLPITQAQNTAIVAFWSFITNTENKSLSLHVWEKVDDRLIEKTADIENTEAPLASFNLMQDDFDFDGSLDYLLLSTKGAGTKEVTLEYIYLDKNLKVKYRFVVDNISVVPLTIGARDIALAKVQFPTPSGFLKTPVFKSTGIAPSIDTMRRFTSQSEIAKALQRPVSTEDYISARGLPVTEANPSIERLYYFEPRKTVDGTLVMQQRALTGHIAEAAILRLIQEQNIRQILSQEKYANLVTNEDVTKALNSDTLFKLIADKGLNQLLTLDEKNKIFNSNILSDLTLIGLLPQSNAEVAAGSFSYLVSLGRGVVQQYYRIQFKNLSQRYEAADIISLNFPPIDLKRNTIKEALSIYSGGVDSLPSFFALYSFSAARAALMRADKIGGVKIELADRKEAIASILKSFTLLRQNDFLNFVETTKNVRAIGTWAGKSVDEAAPVFRTSFLPGYSFSELFEGVLVSERQSPGVLIDSSEIFSNRISVYTLDKDGKMRSSIEHSIEIPKNCRARKRPFLNAKGFSSISAICVDKVENPGSDPQFKARVEVFELN